MPSPALPPLTQESVNFSSFVEFPASNNETGLDEEEETCQDTQVAALGAGDTVVGVVISSDGPTTDLTASPSPGSAMGDHEDSFDDLDERQRDLIEERDETLPAAGVESAVMDDQSQATASPMFIATLPIEETVDDEEMEVELPVLNDDNSVRDPKMDRKVIPNMTLRSEIPDSEDLSEFSSPTKSAQLDVSRGVGEDACEEVVSDDREGGLRVDGLVGGSSSEAGETAGDGLEVSLVETVDVVTLSTAVEEDDRNGVLDSNLVRTETPAEQEQMPASSRVASAKVEEAPDALSDERGASKLRSLDAAGSAIDPVVEDSDADSPGSSSDVETAGYHSTNSVTAIASLPTSNPSTESDKSGQVTQTAIGTSSNGLARDQDHDIEAESTVPEVADQEVTTGSEQVSVKPELKEATAQRSRKRSKRKSSGITNETQPEVDSTPNADPTSQKKALETPNKSMESPKQVPTPSIKTVEHPSPSPDTTSKVTPQNKDALMAELKAMKIAALQARNAALQAEIAQKRLKLAEVTAELKHPAAETVKRHIKLLHEYNDIRDVGQGLIGMIAESRGVRIGELYEEFGVGLKD